MTESVPLFSTGGTHQAPERHPDSQPSRWDPVGCLRLRTSAGVRPASPLRDFNLLHTMVAAHPG